MRDEYIPRILKGVIGTDYEVEIDELHRARDLAFMCRQNLKSYLQIPSSKEGAHISRFARRLICDPAELFAETIANEMRKLCSARLAHEGRILAGADRLDALGRIPIIATKSACMLINEVEDCLKRVYPHLEELHKIIVESAVDGDEEGDQEPSAESIKQYRVNVHLVRARGIPKMDWFSETDSYVMLKLANNMGEMINGIYEKHQTEVFMNQRKPDYNVRVTMECLAPSAILRLEVVDDNTSKVGKVQRDDFIGFADIAVGQRPVSATEISDGDDDADCNASKAWHELRPYREMETRGSQRYKIVSKVEKLKSRGRVEVYFDFTSVPMVNATEKRVYEYINACRDSMTSAIGQLVKPLVKQIVIGQESDYMEGHNWDMLNAVLNEQLRTLSRGLSRPMFIKTILGIFRELCKVMVDLLLPGFNSQEELYGTTRVLRAVSFDAENESKPMRTRSTSTESHAIAKMQRFARNTTAGAKTVGDAASKVSKTASGRGRTVSVPFGNRMFGMSKETRHFNSTSKKEQLNQAQRNSMKILAEVLTEFFGADGKGLKSQAAYDLQGPFALTTILAAFKYPIDTLRMLVNQAIDICAQDTCTAVNMQWASCMNVVLEYRVFVRATGSTLGPQCDEATN